MPIRACFVYLARGNIWLGQTCGIFPELFAFRDQGVEGWEILGLVLKSASCPASQPVRRVRWRQAGRSSNPRLGLPLLASAGLVSGDGPTIIVPRQKSTSMDLAIATAIASLLICRAPGGVCQVRN